MLKRAIPLLLVSALSTMAAPPKGCVGSVAVASFRLSAANALPPSWIQMRNVNNLGPGYRISYQPLDMGPGVNKDAKLALVLVPKALDGQLTVLEPRSAIASTEWTVPFVPKILLVVFGPQGLDEKRLTNLVTRDENLTNALADYADQTAELEAGLQLATELEQDADDDSQRPPRPMTPSEQAIFALVRALNPAVSSYDPLGAGRRAGPATMTGKGMDAFFENAGGLFPGGGALPMIKQWLMPDTEFRSVFQVPVPSDGMMLCAQLAGRTRNRLAYLWAYRLTNSEAPPTTILKNADVPISMRVGVPVKTDADFKLLDHVFDWTLISDGGSQPPIHVAVRPIPDERALRVDLRKFSGAPGAYTMQARWDWSAFKVAGNIRVHRFDDLSAAQLTPESQSKLIAGTGPVDIELTGCDFLFLDHAALHRPQSAHQIALDLPSDRSANLRMEVDTDTLHPGPFMLALSRIDGATADVPIRVLPPNPAIDHAGLRVNAGDRQQTITLSGTGLDRIDSIESDRAQITLAAASEDGTHRVATVRLQSTVKAGDAIALTAKINGIANPFRLPVALQVAGERPKILEAKPSIPRDLTVALKDGELPGGSWVSFAIKIQPADAAPSISLQCAEAARTSKTAIIRAGDKQAFAQASSNGDAMFLSLDPAAIGQSGCTLTAIAEIESLGKSDAFTLGRVVRLPRIESLALSDEKSADGFYGTLRGFDLETIEKTGWSANAGAPATELPRPIAGEGAKQSLRISMPWPSPSPKAPLYIWLRGESEGRATRITP